MQLSVMNMTSRENYLTGLDTFLENCQEKVTKMLDILGWTPDHFIQPKKTVQCPHNKHHVMPPAALEKHEPVCGLIQQGCTKEDAEKILSNSEYFYGRATCVHKVKIDKEILNSVLWNHHVKNHSVYYGHSRMPLTPEEEEQMLSNEDRLGLAEYVIAKSREANRLAQLERDELMVSENLADLIKKDSEEKRGLDPVEEMAALRDYRRRRQSYRAKNVHITKKSHTEIMREVINNQMEMYSKQLQDEAERDTDMQDRVNKMLESVKEEVEEGEYREPSHSQSYDRSGRSREPDSSYQHRRKERSRERDSRHRDHGDDDDDDDDREKRRDKDKKRKHKHKNSRSRSRSRSREKSKSHKKHKKHKHKSHHRHRDRGETPASTSDADTNSVVEDK